jgi:hypothetical protein
MIKYSLYRPCAFLLLAVKR